MSWRSTKQSCVALSTAEAEYVALAAAAQEAIWLRRLLCDLNSHDNSPITVYENNQAAIHLSKSYRNHPKTKHIDIKYHFIRDVIRNEDICVQYCPTDNMIADIFTKSLSANNFLNFREMLGMKLVD